MPSLLSSSTTSFDPNPDFVIVFDPLLKPKVPSSKSPTTNNTSSSSTKDKFSSILTEFSNLISTLKSADFQITTRPGTKKTSEILIFLKCDEKRLENEVHRERLSDWLNGIASTRPSPTKARDFSSDPILPSERLRLIYSILTTESLSSLNQSSGGGGSVKSSSSSGKTCGLTPQVLEKDYPHVKSMFIPHDLKFDQIWLKNWNSLNHILKPINHEELNQIKNYYGESIALYFSFLRYYFASLLYPTLLGLIIHFILPHTLGGGNYSIIYSIGIIFWSIFFIESWKIKEKKLSVSWSTYNLSKVEIQRSSFKGDSKKLDPVTGIENDFFPFYKIFLRQLLSLPVLLLFASILVGLISIIYSVETIVGEVYDGPLKKYLTLIPTVLFAGLVPQFIALWRATARKLTKFENHPHQSEHDQSLTLKVFALNFFVAYGSLILTSYIYIPFGSFLVPYIINSLPSNHAQTILTSSTSGPAKGDIKKTFEVNSGKLHTQIVAYTLTNQIVGAFTEVGLPFLTSKAKKEVKHLQEKKSTSSSRSRSSSPTTTATSTEKTDSDSQIEKAPQNEDLESEHIFLERIREESSLPSYDLFQDYAEMVLQFGYQVLFSTIWPVAPLFAFINNFFELRSDAFKITHQHKRPIPTRQASIGPWLDVLVSCQSTTPHQTDRAMCTDASSGRCESQSFISYLSAFTNASLVYLYRPQHQIHPSFSPSSAAEVASNAIQQLKNMTIPQNLTTNLTAPYRVSNMHLATSGLYTSSSSSFSSKLFSSSSSTSTTYSSILSLLFSALLLSLFSEHLYLLTRSLIKFLLFRLKWLNSGSYNHIRRNSLELRRNYLDIMGLRKGPKELADETRRTRNANEDGRDVDEKVDGNKEDEGKEEEEGEKTEKRVEKSGFWKSESDEERLKNLKRVLKID